MITLPAWGRPSRRWIYVVSPAIVLLLLYHLSRSDLGVYAPFRINKNVAPFDNHAQVSADGHKCRHLHGIDEVLVVMKTGVTEALQKVPVHLNTTLRCIPHYVIFSDYEEEIAGVRTIDVLRSVGEDVTRTNSDFDMYTRVKEVGRDGLLAADWNQDVNSPFGKPGNPGWVLDKWKFLPMIDEALQARPNASWYVFVEADTYVVWPNMMAWLARLDPTTPLYLGMQMQIGEMVFGYGGAGFVISNPAMRMMSEYRASHLAELNRFTADQWAGDCVLGQALSDAGVRLTWSWPMLQSGHLNEMDYISEGYQRRPWCFPAVSYHHMSPTDIESLWAFEQKWFGNDTSALLLIKDVFYDYVYTEPFTTRSDWDNHLGNPDEETSKIFSLADCAAYCQSKSDCLQYLFKNGGCSVGHGFIKGSSAPTMHSGWIPERVNATVRGLGDCHRVDFIAP